MTLTQRRSDPWLGAGLVVTLAALASAGCGSNDSSSPARGPSDASTEASTDASASTGPTVTGPITGGSTGKPFNAAPIDLAAFGYVEEEYFIEGDATAYAFQGTPGSDGVWSVKTTTKAHYKTRILVRHPTRPGEVQRNGARRVAQRVRRRRRRRRVLVRARRAASKRVRVRRRLRPGGGRGRRRILPRPRRAAEPLVKWDPAALRVAAASGRQLLVRHLHAGGRRREAPGLREPPRHPDADAPHRRRRVAVGVSTGDLRRRHRPDSTEVFDGFFIHSRSGGAAELVTAGTTANILGGPTLALIRGDLHGTRLPVRDGDGRAGLLSAATPFSSARQPDTARLHTWEVAGTAHADQYLLDYATQGMPGVDGGSLGCTDVNSGPQHWVVDTGLHEMNTWMTAGCAARHRRSPAPRRRGLRVREGRRRQLAWRRPHGGGRRPDRDVQRPGAVVVEHPLLPLRLDDAPVRHAAPGALSRRTTTT